MTLYLLISGYVQKVGYRQFVKKEAIKLGLKGWVKNLPDKKVEVLAVGSKEDLESLIEQCRKGPFLSVVKNINKEWIKKEQGFEDFTILSTPKSKHYPT